MTISHVGSAQQPDGSPSVTGSGKDSKDASDTLFSDVFAAMFATVTGPSPQIPDMLPDSKKDADRVSASGGAKGKMANVIVENRLDPLATLSLGKLAKDVGKLASTTDKTAANTKTAGHEREEGRTSVPIHLPSLPNVTRVQSLNVGKTSFNSMKMSASLDLHAPEDRPNAEIDGKLNLKSEGHAEQAASDSAKAGEGTKSVLGSTARRMIATADADASTQEPAPMLNKASISRTQSTPRAPSTSEPAPQPISAKVMQTQTFASHDDSMNALKHSSLPITSVTPKSLAQAISDNVPQNRTQASSSNAGSVATPAKHQNGSAQSNDFVNSGSPGSLAMTASVASNPQAGQAQSSNPSNPSVDMRDPSALTQFGQILSTNVNQDKTSFHVQIVPQGMGQLDVTVTKGPDGVQVQVSATQAATYDWLNQELPNLQQSLEAAGVQVSGMKLSLGQGDGDKEKERKERDSHRSPVSGISAQGGVSASPTTSQTMLTRYGEHNTGSISVSV